MELSPEERKQIYDEERTRLEKEAPQAKVQPPRTVLGRAVVWTIGGLLVLGVGGVFADRQYRLHDVKQRLGEAIGKDQGLTETILKIESESSKITFAEVFELCNKSVDARTNLIVELRGLHPEMDYQLKVQLLEYLNAENEFVRAKRELYNKMMQASSASNLYVQQVQDAPSSIYGLSYYTNRVQQLKLKLLEAGGEVAKSADDFMSLYHQMVKEENTISLSASAAGLHFEPIFAKHEAENQRKVKETKDGVEQLALAMVQPPPPTQAGTPTKSTAAKAARPVVPADDLLDLSMLSQMAPASFRVNLKTTKGDVLINVTRAWAPVGVDRFFNLVRAGYYSNCVFYRVMPHFIAQFGISARPEVNRAWMNADIPDDAPNGRSNKRGKVTFAKAGPNTRTTILFINLADNAYLDALGFVPIGEVVEGIENADQLYNGYGDTAQQQPSFAKGGKAFVDQQFPKLDRIITATLAPLNPSETMAR